MSIRYECDQCGSVLKIKDDLAGKPGKCPKCKTPFTVPNVDEDEAADGSGEMSATEPVEEVESHLADGPPTDAEDGFDVDAFLSGDDEAEAAPKSKAAKSARPIQENHAGEDSLDEADEKPSAKRSKSRSDGEKPAESFKIRRGPDAPGKPGAILPPGPDGESDQTPAPSRRPPGTNPNAPAANIASDLLSKSSKKGKKANWDEAEPQKPEEPGFDWDGLWFEARTKLLPVMGGGAAVCLLVYFFIFPMFGGKAFVPKLGTVTGTVTVNGKPLVGARVWFHPVERKQEHRGKTFKVTASVAQTDAAGHYEMIYDPKSNLRGAVIGKCHIEIGDVSDYTGIHEKYYKPRVEPATNEVKAGNQVIDLELSK